MTTRSFHPPYLTALFIFLLVSFRISALVPDRAPSTADALRAAHFLRSELSRLPDDDEAPVDESLLSDYLSVGDHLLSAGMHEEAEDIYRHSLSLRPDGDPATTERLSFVLRSTGRHLEAAETLRLALDGAVDGSVASWLYCDIGSVLEEARPLPGCGPDLDDGDADSPIFDLNGCRLSAPDCYRKATTLDESNGEAFKRLADALMVLPGKEEEALEMFRKAGELMPEDVCCATHVALGLPKEDGATRSAPPLTKRVTTTTALQDISWTKEALERDVDGAAAAFERDGVLVLPRFLEEDEVDVLASAVEGSLRDTETPDFTSETREPEGRSHGALSIGGAAGPALDDVLRRLRPLFSRVLQAGGAVPLIGSGFMAVRPGAARQVLHKDVHGHDRFGGGFPGCGSSGGGPRTVSIQLQLTDTTADYGKETTAVDNKGSLGVLPGSHRPDARRGGPEAIRRAIMDTSGREGVVSVSVPPGTVTMYSSRLWHFGGGNESDGTRTFCFLTITESGVPAPPGLIHTMHMGDVGKWMVTQHGLRQAEVEV